MSDNNMYVPGGVDILIENPKKFLFFIYMIMLRKKRRKLDSVELSRYLKTTREGIEEFIITGIPPIGWILILTKSLKGHRVLRFFSLPTERGVLLKIERAMIDGEEMGRSVDELFLNDISR